ncbi:MAG: 4Fe-4S dicluster domain-containing protein [Dehalococcoidales bacterium]|nr:4Fe-4S dicluster domain-containing protein [Dehalococcoidales bacterium]
MKKIYIKDQVCIGCHFCEVYCQLQQASPKDPLRAFKKDLPLPSPRCRVEEKNPLSLSIRCQQCEDAPCVQACLTGALTRDTESSSVQLDEEKCIGCWTCLLVCPFGAIRQNRQEKRVTKCDLCQGREIPACVTYCPNEALVYLEADEQLSVRGN